MKTIKTVLFFVLILLLNFVNILNIVNYSSSTIKKLIFIFMSVIIWITSIRNWKEISNTKKVLSILFIISLLVIGYFAENWKYWYPIKMWETSWLYIPIILFVTSKIINSNNFVEKIGNDNKKVIITYIFTFVIVLSVIGIIEKITENIEMESFIHPYLGIISSGLFLYQLYRFFEIKVNKDILIIILVLIELINVVLINTNEFKKINKYRSSVESIISVINSGELNYKNINRELENRIINYKEPYDNIKQGTEDHLSYEGYYSLKMYRLQTNLNLIDKNNYDEFLDYLENEKKYFEFDVNLFKKLEIYVLINMVSTILETIIFIYLSNRENRC